MEIIFNENQIKTAVNFILENKKYSIIRIDGEIGSGKTTLIKSLCKSLGVRENVSSPTFSIVNEYHGNEVIFHFDFYRLESEEEAYDFGIEEYFDSGNLCLLEWPEKISNLLPSSDLCLDVQITMENNIRIYNF